MLEPRGAPAIGPTLKQWCSTSEDTGVGTLITLFLATRISFLIGSRHRPFLWLPPDVQRCQRQCRDSYFADRPGTVDLCGIGCAYYAEGGLNFCQCTCIGLAHNKVQLEACYRGCGFGELFQLEEPLSPQGKQDGWPDDAGATVPPTAPLTSTHPPAANTEKPEAGHGGSITGDSYGPTHAGCLDHDQDIYSFMARLIGQELDCATLSELGSCAAETGLAEVRHLCAASCDLCNGTGDAGSPRGPSSPSDTTASPEDAEPGKKTTHPSRLGMLWGMGSVLFVLLIVVTILVTLRRRHNQRGSWTPGAKMRVAHGRSSLPGDYSQGGAHTFVMGPFAGYATGLLEGESRASFTRTMVLPPSSLVSGSELPKQCPASEGTVRHQQPMQEECESFPAAAEHDPDGLPSRSPVRAWHSNVQRELLHLEAESQL